MREPAKTRDIETTVFTRHTTRDARRYVLASSAFRPPCGPLVVFHSRCTSLFVIDRTQTLTKLPSSRDFGHQKQARISTIGHHAHRQVHRQVPERGVHRGKHRIHVHVSSFSLLYFHLLNHSRTHGHTPLMLEVATTTPRSVIMSSSFLDFGWAPQFLSIAIDSRGLTFSSLFFL